MKCITLVVCSSESTGRSAASTWNGSTASLPRLPTTRSGPVRVLIDPDYNSTSGQGVRIIGYSTLADDIIAVIVLENDGIEYGVNGWSANSKDRRIYTDGSYDPEEGEADEQEEY